jgi:hypothetical protein
MSVTSGGNAGNRWIRKTIGGTEDTIIVGFALRVTNNDSGSVCLCSLQENGTRHSELWMSTGTTTYNLIATRAGTTLGTATAAITDGTWMYVEFKTTIHDTTGTFIVKVNGVEVLNLSSQDTRNGGTGYVDQVALGNPNGNNSNHTIDFDDWYVLDDTGSAPNNDFLGDVRVAALLPNGAGNSTQMTASAGSNYQTVDENTPNGDTDYVSETTVGEKDTYTMTNLPTNADAVYGVKEAVYARKDDAGAVTLRQVIRTGGTDYEGGDIALLDSYKFFQAIREQNPNTTAAWTQSDIDGIEAGQKLQA